MKTLIRKFLKKYFPTLEKFVHTKIIKRRVKRWEKNIDAISQLLYDEYSKNILKYEFDSVIKKKDCYPPKTKKPYPENFFDSELLTFSENEIYVDGGAYDGDTAIKFMKNVKNRFKNMYLFEPNPISFEKLTENLEKVQKNKIKFFNLGLYNSKRKIGFDLSDTASTINKNSSNFISTIKLDNCINEVTFIKLDLVGSELQALKGAQKLIKKCKPKLAISVDSNLPINLWKIPVYIHSLNLGYKFYMRKYDDKAANGYKLHIVCYAIP